MRSIASICKTATQAADSDTALGKLTDAASTAMAFTEIEQAAVKSLMRRDHTCWELQVKLRQKGYDPVAITTVLQSLQDKGLLSDQRFAESYVHMRVGRGYGPMRIANELRERRVADEIVASCLAEYSDAWQEQIQAVRQKRFGKIIPKDAASRARQMRFLLYRGFTSEQINRLFNTY